MEEKKMKTELPEELRDKYGTEQVEKFNTLYQKLVQVDKEVDEYLSGEKALSHPVLKRRIALIALGEHLPNYKEEVPEDVRDAFGFDEKGLVNKVNKLLDG